MPDSHMARYTACTHSSENCDLFIKPPSRIVQSTTVICGLNMIGAPREMILDGEARALRVQSRVERKAGCSSVVTRFRLAEELRPRSISGALGMLTRTFRIGNAARRATSIS